MWGCKESFEHVFFERAIIPMTKLLGSFEESCMFDAFEAFHRNGILGEGVFWLGHTNLIYRFSSSPACRFLETDKIHTHNMRGMELQ